MSIDVSGDSMDMKVVSARTIHTLLKSNVICSGNKIKTWMCLFVPYFTGRV